MAVGFSFKQRMRGTFHRLTDPGTELPFELTTQLLLPLPELLRRRTGRVTGTIDAEGLATRAPFSGTVQIDLRDRKIVYDVHFHGDDDRPRRFHGETEFWMRRAVRAMEEVVGRIYDGAEEEARVLASVKLTTGIRRMLRTLRAGFTTHLAANED